MKLWEGLGYYSRARNLQKAARMVVEVYDGKFPETYEGLLSLAGIGEYTAGAIASAAYSVRVPAVDGNVLRVLSRILDDDTPIDLPAQKKKIRQLLEAVYPEDAGDFTQALMELGATVCGPNRKPDCGNCPCRNFCRGYRSGRAEALPVKMPKKGRKTVDMTVFVLRCEDSYALEKRPDSGLLAGLWQFPNREGMLEISDALAYVEHMGLKPREIIRQVERKHIFTHIQWNMRGVYIEVAEKAGGFSWMTEAQIEKEAALPTAFRQFWEETENV